MRLPPKGSRDARKDPLPGDRIRGVRLMGAEGCTTFRCLDRSNDGRDIVYRIGRRQNNVFYCTIEEWRLMVSEGRPIITNVVYDSVETPEVDPFTGQLSLL